MEPYSCYFTCRCNRTRAEHESQQTQRYPAAEDPHRRVWQEGLPGGVRTNREGGWGERERVEWIGGVQQVEISFVFLLARVHEGNECQGVMRGQKKRSVQRIKTIHP